MSENGRWCARKDSNLRPPGSKPGVLAPVPAHERVWIAALAPANSDELRHLPAEMELELCGAETELCGDGTAYVAAASPWHWGGPEAGEVVGEITLRRSGQDGDVWDLVVVATFDPDVHGLVHRDLLVHYTTEARAISGLPPLSRWWCDSTMLRPLEAAAVEEACASAVLPPRSSSQQTAAVVRLNAGSQGEISGEVVLVGSLGLAYVLVTDPGALSLDTAVRALRVAVIDGRVNVPLEVRVALDTGTPLLAVKGGAL